MTKGEIALQIFNSAVDGLNARIWESSVAGNTKEEAISKNASTYASIYNTIYNSLTFTPENS